MRLTFEKTLQVFYLSTLLIFTGLFAYGVKYYWQNGLINTEYVSNLYDASNRVKSVKDRDDARELLKYINGDRLKEAQLKFKRIESDVKDLKLVKSIDSGNPLEAELKTISAELNNIQNRPDINTIINRLTTSVTGFENFVSDNNWPTISRMTRNLRMKLSPSRLMINGMYSLDRIVTLNETVANDLEALTNFVKASDLKPDVVTALVNRLKVLKTDAENLQGYVEERKSINNVVTSFTKNFNSWFKTVEPEISLKKMQFEKSSNTIIFSLIGAFTFLIASFVSGIFVYNFVKRRNVGKIEKLIVETLKEKIIAVEAKPLKNFSAEFNLEITKYREYIHKRMSFGAIFQESIPFATIILDSELGLVWGNKNFYEEWQLQNFKDDGDSLNWEFLKRFTDITDESILQKAFDSQEVLNQIISVKTNSMAESVPFDMYVTSVDYAGEKRVVITFYPETKKVEALRIQKENLLAPLNELLDLQLKEELTIDLKNEIKEKALSAGSEETYLKSCQLIEKVEQMTDELHSELEIYETKLSEETQMNEDLKKKLSNTIELQRESIALYSVLRDSFLSLFDSRDQVGDQFKLALENSRDLFKIQSDVFNVAVLAESNITSYEKSVRQVTQQKVELKTLKNELEEYKSKVTQILDQLLVFQTNDTDFGKLDQSLSKIKAEMRSFEKVLKQFTEISTNLDVAITKLDILLDSREMINLDEMSKKILDIKSNLENVQFTGQQLVTQSQAKDEELFSIVKKLVTNLKTEIRYSHEMGSTLKMNYKEVNAKSNFPINPSNEV